MIHNNDGFNDLESNEDINAIPGKIEADGTVNVAGTSFTQEEIEQANKPQPNVILNTADVNSNTASTYRDPERVDSSSNEASDSTDTNTGGIIAGGAKGTSQS